MKIKSYITPLLLFLLTYLAIGNPTIQLNNPKEDSITVYNPNINFIGQVLDGNQLTINGISIPLEKNGEFNYSIELSSKDSNNYFLIEATSDSGSSQLTRTIYYNTNSLQNTSMKIKEKNDKTIEHKYKEELDHKQKIAKLKAYIGNNEKCDYSFSEITLDDFIKIINYEYKINIINNTIPEKTLSIELTDIHPIDVFDTLINYWGYTWVLKDNIVHIIKQMPIRVFKLDYIQGSELIELVNGLSTITSFKANPIDNSIIAMGTYEELDYLAKLIRELDVKPKQVLIEATIIETTFDVSSIFGTNPAHIVESSESTNTSIFNLQTLGFAFPISTLENNSNINILANPQILVTNHKTAKIETGNNIGYSTVTITDTQTIETINFLTTGITLEITPHISQNNEILMEIKPSISEGLVHENKPKSSQTSTDTQVIIRDGETIIIGGLIQKKQTTLRSYNIPILSNIPILNTLLGQEEKTDHKIEISVLITPHIIHDSQDQVNEKL